MLIWFMNKIYLFFILACCVQLYLLPFSYRLRLRFSLPSIKIKARTQTQRNLTKVKDRNPPTTAHTMSVALITGSKMTYM